MYVAKIIKNKIKFDTTLYKKTWSEELLSNKIEIVSNKNFIFRRSAHRWIQSEISRDLFLNKKLEIVDD